MNDKAAMEQIEDYVTCAEYDKDILLDIPGLFAASPWNYNMSACEPGRKLYLYRDSSGVYRSYSGFCDHQRVHWSDLTRQPGSPIAWAAINLPEDE